MVEAGAGTPVLRIAELDAEFVAYARQDEACRRLIEIPGIGATIATALAAAVGPGTAFEAGRDMAASLALVPRQRSTGGVPRLLGISKRGNKYLRKLLVHGARAALPHLAQQPHSLGRWLAGLLVRAHRNVAVVALANKLARIAWAVLSDNRSLCGARRRGGLKRAQGVPATSVIGRRARPARL
jgi:transposase